jgi:hypothetical protein
MRLNLGDILFCAIGLKNVSIRVKRSNLYKVANLLKNGRVKNH